jgi:hypothetical protein
MSSYSISSISYTIIIYNYGIRAVYIPGVCVIIYISLSSGVAGALYDVEYCMIFGAKIVSADFSSTYADSLSIYFIQKILHF